MMLTPSQLEELSLFLDALRILERDLDNSPYFDEGIREGLKAALAAGERQLTTAPVS